MEYDFSQFIRDSDGKIRSNRKLNNNNYGKMGDETWYDYLQNNKESMVQSDYAPVNEGNADFGFVARNDNGYAPLSRKDKLKNYDAALNSVKHKLEGKDSVQVEEAIESNPEEFVDSSSPEIAKEAQQIVNSDDKRDDEVNNTNVEKALRKAIPGSEPDPLEANNMGLSEDQIKAIKDEYNKWKANEYAGNDKASRKKMDQYYTPPELTIKMLSNYGKLDGKRILDPTAGAGHLLAAAIMAGADPNLIYANEPDSNIRNNVLIPRLTGLGVPLRNIGPYPSVVKKYGEFGVNGGRAGDARDANYSYGTLVDNDNDFLSDPDNKALYDKVYNSIKKDNPEGAIETIVEEHPEAAQEAEQVLSETIGPNKAEEITGGINKEAQQIVNNDDKRDDEVNNANVERALRKTIPGSEPDPLGVNISNEERANWNGGKDRAVGDATLSEMDNALASRTRPVKPGTEMLDRAKPKGLLGAGMLYSKDNNIPKPSEERPLDANNLEQITESNPEAVQEALPNTPIAEEARQITDDSDARNNEVNNQAAEETVSRLSDDFETVDDLYNYLETVNGMGWNNGRVDDVDLNGPDFPVDNNVYAKDEDFVGPDEVVDYGLEDQNQYPAGIDDSDETVVQENVPGVNENDFVKSDVLPSADNVLELKPDEQEVVTEAIEENVPEEEKDKYFGMLGFPHRKLGGFSPSSVSANNEQYKLDRLNRAGASSLGRLGGFSTGSGSVSPGIVSTGISKPRAMTERVSSRAGGGNIPKSPNAAANAQVGSRAGNSNNGFITSNGGNISSGPVQKRNSLKSPKPIQLPNFTGHTASIQTNPLGSAEDLHEALVERIKGMLDNLDPETRKKLGFSPTLYNYNGTPLDKLDGATLVQLSEMLEGIVN